MKWREDKYNYIILGAGAPHTGSSPSVLRQPSFSKSVLDWILEAYSINISDVNFVAGYCAHEIKQKYPSLKIFENIHWKKTGSFHSLLLANPKSTKPLFVSYGDVLFRKKLIKNMNKSKASIVIAYDSLKQNSSQILENREKIIVYNNHTLRLGYDVPHQLASGEFVGVVKFSPEVINEIIKIKHNLGEIALTMSISEAIEFLRCRGFNIEAIDVNGEWVEVRDSCNIARFVMGTKAETLHRLRKVLKTGIIQDQVSFSIAEWNKNNKLVLETIRKKLLVSQETMLIVRSSSRKEDTFRSSNAGSFESVLDVNSEKNLEEAIEQVINSYGLTRVDDDQILVQPMLNDVLLSGVAFTRTIENQAPWYVINYEVANGTQGITGGTSKNHLTICISRKVDPDILQDPNLTSLMTTFIEIENLLGYDLLDIEFSVTRKGEVCIFQVRPLIFNQCTNTIPDDKYFVQLEQAKLVWESLQKTPTVIPGIQKPMYGIMPDWNPAEIIGTAPGALASSLYEFLIMDNTWATQRAEYGYIDVRPSPLMVNFAGRPYVDVRASFASFIPASLDRGLASRLLSFYLDWFGLHPEFHDKIEFEVVPTCLAPDFPYWKNRLMEEAGFSEEEVSEIRSGLYNITDHAFTRYEVDYAQIQTLSEHHSKIVSTFDDPLERAFALLDVCRRFGALPFAHLARSAFIAITLLRSAVRVGIISEEANKSFLSTIRTVSNSFKEDAFKVNNHAINWEDFIKKYGHLRPGTYEIKSPRYDSKPEFFLQPLLFDTKQDIPVKNTSAIWLKERTVFLDALREMNLPNRAEEVENFLRLSIQGREYAKFIFTRSLSDALESLKQFGKKNGLDSSILSNIPLADFFSLRDDKYSTKTKIKKLKEIAIYNNELQKISGFMKLPAVLSKKDDFDFFTYGPNMSNFIGQKQIIGECVEIKNIDGKKILDVKGKIALIHQADPGFDWLFGQGIIGLVTMYGGANSHMAIRSTEFGLTAAIGVGEKLYAEIASAQTISINPLNKTLRVLL